MKKYIKADSVDDLFKGGNIDARYDYARSGKDPTLLSVLGYDPEDLVRGRAAMNPRTPPEVLSDLLHDVNPHIAMMALENPYTPASDSETYSVLCDLYARGCAAEWSRAGVTPYDWAFQQEEIIYYLCGNPNISAELVQEFFNTMPLDITAIPLSGNPSVSGDVLREVFKETIGGELCNTDMESDIYNNLARNPNTPDDVLHVLASFHDFSISSAAKSRLGIGD